MVSKNIAEFRKILKKALILEDKEMEVFDKIPDEHLDEIFVHNFQGVLALAERLMLNRYDESDRIDGEKLEKETQKIANLKKAGAMMTNALKENRNVLFITDNDSDGSLAQAVLIEYLKTLPKDKRDLIHIEYAQPIGKSRGFNVDLVDLAVNSKGWKDTEDFLIVTADNGINSVAEQKAIQKKYKNSQLIVTDHHLPEPDEVIQENDKTIIFNPKYKTTDFYEKFNISGASTLGVLLKEVIKQSTTELNLDADKDYKTEINNITEISKWANFLDYVNTHISDKPVRPYIIEKALGIAPLMNVNNSLNNIITKPVPDKTFEAIKANIPDLDDDKFRAEIENIQLLNITAKKLLKIYAENSDPEIVNNFTKRDFYRLYTNEIGGSTGEELFNDDAGRREALNLNAAGWIKEWRNDLKVYGKDLATAKKADVLSEGYKNVEEALKDEQFYITFEGMDVFKDAYKKFNKAKTTENKAHKPEEFSFLTMEDKRKVFELLKIKDLGDVVAEFKNEQYLAHKKAYEQKPMDNINPNYVEQMRPIIFNLSAIDNKNDFLNKINQSMINVFEQLQKSEKALQVELRKGKILASEKLEFSTIRYPIDKEITKSFNRKFLGKAYNEENNGFLLTLDHLGKNKVSGSFRSLYSINDIFEGKEEFEELLNIKLTKAGHATAAGFFITSPDAITPQTISEVNKFINSRIAEIRKNDLSVGQDYLLTDFAAIPVIDKINKAVKGNLSNLKSLTPVIKLNSSTYLTNTKNAEQKSLQALTKDKQYGYLSVNLNFHGDSIIIPTELVRQMEKNNFKDYLKISYLDTGVFMGTHVVEADKVRKTIDLRAGRTDQLEISKYYEENFKGDHVIELTRKQLTDIPYFKNNTYGEKEFKRFENAVIAILDKTKNDVFSVIDTEGVGLGKAPKCVNFGATDFYIDEKTGTSIDKETFYNNAFQNIRGRRYLLNDEQSKELVKIEREQYDELPFEDKKNVLIRAVFNDKKTSFEYFVHNPKDESSLNKFDEVDNFSVVGNQVVYNRQIKATFLAWLIKDTDFKLAPEMINLTGLDNTMINKYGEKTEVVDQFLVDHYKGKKAIVQAHNLPYDKGVLSANMPLYNAYVESQTQSDSALSSRRFKLAYDETPVTSFDNVQGLSSTLYFYDSPHCDYSLSNFLDKKQNGVYPDRTGKILLKISGDADDKKLSLIDKANNNEFLLTDPYHEIVAKRTTSSLPNTSIKYSVQKLSLAETIRSIVLSDEDFNIKNIEVPADLKNYATELKFFQDEYHFDSSLETNIYNFLKTVGFDSSLEAQDLKDFGKEFLEANKKIQAKFNEGWIYEKVLLLKEPNNRREVTNDLVEQVAYQTDLPEAKIRQVFEDTLNYKELFGIPHALVHEQHNNIKFEGDKLADTMYESILSVKRLFDRTYNSYSFDITEGLHLFLQTNIKDAELQFNLREIKDQDLALDSFSVRQMLTFGRKNKTEAIKSIKDHFKDVTVKPVKFKLGGDILPPDTAVYAQPKHNMDQKEIQGFADKIAFIISNEQLKVSAATNDNLSPLEVENFMKILESNTPKILKMKEEILEHFDSVVFNRKDAELKKIAEILEDAGNGQVADMTKVKITVDESDIVIFENLLEKYEKVYKKIGKTFDTEVAMEVLSSLSLTQSMTDYIDTQIEKPEPVKEDMTKIRSKNFFPDIDIFRREPIDWMTRYQPMLINEHLKSLTLDKPEQEKELRINSTYKM
jgi:hypothetical protein